MKVKDLMTKEPTCCGPETQLQEIAKKMVDCDCGMIPIVDDGGRAIGAVTDRDIVCRAVAENRNPLELTAQDVMTQPLTTISPDAEVEELLHLLEEKQLRRIVVADDSGRCIGVVAQADLARGTPDEAIAEVVREVSREAQAQHAN
ncbi:MAG: CBS domain-containing protein [Myxococcales bacterium]|jgi:CBS domain-containing protein|nr:CBS domain-containing protein [Myxococcales bacterium]